MTTKCKGCEAPATIGHYCQACYEGHGMDDALDRLRTQDRNILILVKGQERYVFCYHDDQRSETLRTLGRFAANPELSLTWHDAAVLCDKIRKQEQKANG